MVDTRQTTCTDELFRNSAGPCPAANSVWLCRTPGRSDARQAGCGSSPPVGGGRRLSSFAGSLSKSCGRWEAPFSTGGECAGCQHNSGNQQALFGEAIASGHCTHGSCFDAKTEASLGAKKASLSDEYPDHSHIVRPGENFTLLRLVAEGDTGVGEEQAKACRACKNFGAAISAVPEGNVYPILSMRHAMPTGVALSRKGEYAPRQVRARMDPARRFRHQSRRSSRMPKLRPRSRIRKGSRIIRLEVWRKALRRELMN